MPARTGWPWWIAGLNFHCMIASSAFSLKEGLVDWATTGLTTFPSVSMTKRIVTLARSRRYSSFSG